jgi:hypothetical protein
MQSANKKWQIKNWIFQPHGSVVSFQSWHLHDIPHLTLHTDLYKRCESVGDRPVTKGSLLGEKGNLTAIYIFYSRKFLNNTHLALYAHCLQAVTLRSVSNNGNFICWTKNIHDSISTSIRGIFLKLPSTPPPKYSRLAYKTPHIVLGPKWRAHYFREIFVLHFEGSFWNSTPNIPRALRVNYLCWIAIGQKRRVLYL